MAESPSSAPADRSIRTKDLLREQVRLLFGNANVGVAVTLVAAAVLGFLQRDVVSRSTIAGWCGYMFLVSGARFALSQLYRRKGASPDPGKWAAAFAVGAGLAGAGWGAAGLLLYPPGQLINQVYLVFTLGGMMLGAAPILAPRREAFLAFMAPAGLAPSARLMLQGGEGHLAMGLLAGVFTLATIITTGRIHGTIVSSLRLQFENRDLVDDLLAAKRHADELNDQLERRVRERTAELQQSTEQLRAEIVQREQAEEALLRARKLESLGVLAGGIAHDFNNFLTVVQGNTQMARLQLRPDDPVQAVLLQTEAACLRAAFLASQLLTFAGGGVPVRRLVPVAKLVNDAVQLARAGAQTTMEVYVPDDLHCAEVDPGQIGQVLHNILLNARQAMAEGGIIEVRAENMDDRASGEPRVRISIHDSGCGIPPAVLPRIFDPYFSTKQGSSGLGLATAYAIVRKHGGQLSVESEPGAGSTFTVELPASLATAEPHVAPEAQLQSGTERLLVMDDETSLRQLLQALLTNLGYQVQTARDGAEAIALCEDAITNGRPFDAALLDLTVSGGLGGQEAAVRLKEVDPKMRLVVSSGYSESPVMANFRSYGFDDVLPKPWTVPELSELFRRVLAPVREAKARTTAAALNKQES